MDVFNKNDQVQIMTGNAALGGLGGLAGFFLSSSLPVLALPVSACLNAIFTVLNVISVPEISLKKLKNDGDAPEVESLKKRMTGRIRKTRLETNLLQKINIKASYAVCPRRMIVAKQVVT